jgi:hypothetical protein
MSDNEIRKILAERKREARRKERREETVEIIESFFAWGGLLTIAFMMSCIG